MIDDVWRNMDSIFECQLCKGEAVKCTTLKCDHVFCADCLLFNAEKPDCPVCFEEKRDYVQNKLAIEFLKSNKEYRQMTVTIFKRYDEVQKDFPSTLQVKSTKLK